MVYWNLTGRIYRRYVNFDKRDVESDSDLEHFKNQELIRYILQKESTEDLTSCLKLKSLGYLEKLEFSFEIKACEKFYRRRPEGSALGVHIIN